MLYWSCISAINISFRIPWEIGRKRREGEQVRYVQVSFFKSFPLGINLPSSLSSRPVFRAKFKTLFSFYARSGPRNSRTARHKYFSLLTASSAVSHHLLDRGIDRGTSMRFCILSSMLYRVVGKWKRNSRAFPFLPSFLPLLLLEKDPSRKHNKISAERNVATDAQ